METFPSSHNRRSNLRQRLYKDAQEPDSRSGPRSVSIDIHIKHPNSAPLSWRVDGPLQPMEPPLVHTGHATTPSLLSMAPGALSADFDSIWTSVSVWKGGSVVKRITQNSPMRCSVTPCQFFSSIHPSIVPSFARSSFHLPVRGYLCLFLPPSRRYCPSVACFPHPSPPFSLC